MPGVNQKTVTIKGDTWEKVTLEFETNSEYWSNQGVGSTTALLEYFVLQGVSGRRDEVRAIHDELRELKILVKEKLENP